MGLLKNIAKGIGNVVGDIGKLAVQPIATAVNSVAGKEKIKLEYSTGAGKVVSKINTTVDKAANTLAKSVADGFTGGLATKGVNKLRSADAQEEKFAYNETKSLGKVGVAIMSLGKSYGEKQAANVSQPKIPVSPNSNPIPLSASTSSTPSDMSLFSAIGQGLVAQGKNIVQQGIASVIKQATTQTANPAQSAAGLAAPASTVGPFVAVNQQGTGNGVFSQVQGFMGGGTLQKNGVVVPQVAQGIAAYSGGTQVDIGGGYSINVPGQPGTNLPGNQGSSTMPTWAMPLIWVFGGIVAIVLIFKVLSK